MVGGSPHLGLQGTGSWEMVSRASSKFQRRLVMNRAEQTESQHSMTDVLRNLNNDRPRDLGGCGIAVAEECHC